MRRLSLEAVASAQESLLIILKTRGSAARSQSAALAQFRRRLATAIDVGLSRAFNAWQARVSRVQRHEIVRRLVTKAVICSEYAVCAHCFCAWSGILIPNAMLQPLDFPSPQSAFPALDVEDVHADVVPIFEVDAGDVVSSQPIASGLVPLYEISPNCIVVPPQRWPIGHVPCISTSARPLSARPFAGAMPSSGLRHSRPLSAGATPSPAERQHSWIQARMDRQGAGPLPRSRRCAEQAQRRDAAHHSQVEQAQWYVVQPAVELPVSTVKRLNMVKSSRADASYREHLAHHCRQARELRAP